MAANWLISQLAGPVPWAHHILNQLLYGLAVFLFFLMARKWLTMMTAALATLLFITAPYHVEAIAWIAALPEVLSAVLILLVMLLHMRSRTSWWQGGLLFGCYLAALLTREHALVVPLLMIWYDGLWQRWQRWSTFNGQAWHYVWVAAALLLYFLLRVNALGFFLTDASFTYPLTAIEIILNWPVIISTYLLRLISVVPYSGFYYFDPIGGLLAWEFWLSIALLALILILAVKKRVQATMAVFYLGWIVITLLPFLYLPALGENILTDRYMFLPSVGAMMVLAWLLKIGWDRAITKNLRVLYRLLLVALVMTWGGYR